MPQPPCIATFQNASPYKNADLQAYLEVCADLKSDVCPSSSTAGGILMGAYDSGIHEPTDSRGRLEPEL